VRVTQVGGRERLRVITMNLMTVGFVTVMTAQMVVWLAEPHRL